jgi:hypothetical protein
MPLAGLEPAVPPNQRPQVHALDRGATGIGINEIHGRETSVKCGEIERVNCIEAPEWSLFPLRL